jgi:uncharacterized membrane protein YoaK (UPF0700 family)
MVLFLAITGGGVDAVIFLGFGVLTAAQTGNTITLATALAQGRFPTALYAAVSVAGYLFGAVVGEMVIVRQRPNTAWLSALGWTLVVELAPLSALLVIWRFVAANPMMAITMALVALAAIAMGIQSAAVLRLDAGPTTTYVTGTLTSFATELIRLLHLLETKKAPITGQQETDSANLNALVSSDGPWFYAITWLVYAGGAVVSGILFVKDGEMALLLPIAALIAAIAVDHDIR